MIRVPEISFHAADHCTKRCVACNQAAPWRAERFMSRETLARDLELLGRYVRPDRIVALGGEPLLNPDLAGLLHEAGRWTDRVGVLTNGMLLDRQPEEFWRSIHLMSISQYPGLDPAQVDVARSQQARYGFELYVNPFTVFYRTMVRAPRNAAGARATFQHCPFKGFCRIVDYGYFYLCPQAITLPEVHPALQGQAVQEGLPLDDRLTEAQVSAYLERAEPLASCAVCAYTDERPWRQAPTYTEWLEASYVD